MDDITALVIALPSEVSRKDKISSELNEQQLSFDVVEAMNAKHLTKQHWDQHATTIGQALTPVGLAVALSHMKAWKAVVDRGLQRAIILESDATGFCAKFKQRVIECIKHTPSDYHVLLVGCTFCDQHYSDYFGAFVYNLLGSRPHLPVNDYVHVPSNFNATHAYVISYEGAKYCLKQFNQVSFHLDVCMNKDLGLKLYRTNDKLCTQQLFVGDSANATDNWAARMLDKVVIDNGTMGLGMALSMNLFEVAGVRISSIHLVVIVLVILLVILISRVVIRKGGS